MWISRDELTNLKSKINELEHQVACPPLWASAKVRYCSECGVAYEKRLKPLSYTEMYPEGKSYVDYDNECSIAEHDPVEEEVTNCTWCDEAVKEKELKAKRLEEAINVAKSCPEAVIDLGKKKVCKGE